jgi:tRNA threonylcarbamoyladenosine biosynthesis protein TsaE
MKKIMTSEQELRVFAQTFAMRIKSGAVIELVGDVGAGKTTFVKALAVGLGITETVQSPSFTLFSRYDIPGGGSLHHYDFYRLDEPGVVVYGLAESVADTNAITVIEWAETVHNVLPKERTIIRLQPLSDTSRQLDITERT